jgi:hypothetical protein
VSTIFCKGLGLDQVCGAIGAILAAVSNLFGGLGNLTGVLTKIAEMPDLIKSMFPSAWLPNMNNEAFQNVSFSSY